MAITEYGCNKVQLQLASMNHVHSCSRAVACHAQPRGITRTPP